MQSIALWPCYMTPYRPTTNVGGFKRSQHSPNRMATHLNWNAQPTFLRNTHWPIVTQREDCCLINGRGCPFAVSLASKGWNDKHFSSGHRASRLSNKTLGRHANLACQRDGSEERKRGLDDKTHMQAHKQQTQITTPHEKATHRAYTQEITTFTNSDSTTASLTEWAHAW